MSEFVCRITPSANEVLLTYVQLNVGESLPIAWVFERAFELAQQRGSKDIEADEMQKAIHESVDSDLSVQCQLGHKIATAMGFEAKL